ncbi:site-specific integrase [bacterium]|nr:site-specific integrase [bacterium]
MSVSLRAEKGKKKTWKYDFVLKGKRTTKSGFKTKREANDAEAERRKEILEKKNAKSQEATQTDTTFLEMVNLRLDDIKIYCSEVHYKDHFYMARRWVAEWGDLLCAEIDSKMIKKFVISRAITSRSTANKEIRYLKATFNFAKEENLVNINPVDAVKFLSVEKQRKYMPPPEDVEKIISVADPNTRDYLWVIIGTVARVGEINNLKWDDVNLTNRTVTLYTRKKKGGNKTPRDIPMTNWLYDILKKKFDEKNPALPWVFWHRYWSSKKMDWVEGQYKDRKRLMSGLCKKAGVRYFRFHALRHLGASILEKENTPITDIQGILGHEKRSTTEIYLHSIGTGKVAAMEQFEEFWAKSHHSHTTSTKTQERVKPLNDLTP